MNLIRKNKQKLEIKQIKEKTFNIYISRKHLLFKSYVPAENVEIACCVGSRQWSIKKKNNKKISVFIFSPARKITKKMATEAIKTKAQQEEIIAEFQNMRNEQRMLATKLNTLEMDLKEHK